MWGFWGKQQQNWNDAPGAGLPYGASDFKTQDCPIYKIFETWYSILICLHLGILIMHRDVFGLKWSYGSQMKYVPAFYSMITLE